MITHVKREITALDVPSTRVAKNAMARHNGPQSPALNAPDAALYIAALAGELARIAKRHDLETLAYILDMAKLEADRISRQGKGDDGSFSSPR
jgi:hypothetical protein